VVILAADLLGGATLRKEVNLQSFILSKGMSLPAVASNGQRAQGRAVRPHLATEGRDIEANELHQNAGLLIDMLNVLGLVAAIDLASVALRRGSGGGEDEEGGSGGEGNDTGEHLEWLVVGWRVELERRLFGSGVGKLERSWDEDSTEQWVQLI
jgi:hypothetical protein